MPAKKRDVYYIEVVGRAFDVLEVFVHAKKAQLTLKEIAVCVKQSPNTVFRLLYTLTKHGYIVKTDKKYELGSKLLDLTNAKLRHTDLIDIAGPYMDALREQFHETVNLGILAEGQMRYIEVRESPERFRLAETVGGHDPLHCTALGKVHLAHLPPPEVRRLMREYGMPRLTPNTITTLTGLKTELDEIRARGYAIDREESMLGAFCVAVAILDVQERPIAAMSIAGPQVRFNESHLKPVADALREAVAAISQKLCSSGKPSAGRAALGDTGVYSNFTHTNPIRT